MDIDDILADVSTAAEPQESRDLQQLTRAWVAERVAPEVLPWPAGLMDRIEGRIRRQIELVEEQTGNMDPKANFRLIVIQTELERFKFLVRSFLRARIAKIDKYAQHYLSLAAQQPTLLAPTELQYLQAHIALLSRHYSTSFLSAFPPSLQRLDDTAGGISMVDGPDLDTVVFCRVLRDVGTVRVEGTDVEMNMRRGDVWVVRWGSIRNAVVERGDIELI
ncbi:hypothetical protein W97_04716 [Coniosporium apollinis CBS 100218]|uniref:DNA replication complex GINS protein SLD5 n=1 Tax=Coniosporium apollinis (strain CBS 100218) TaxID=1168221 RepID=R7YUF0_CONA1|nr:uncharacterized protein W97_04716 [Coniosporium apollinis CBS 100218]EON65478.1 hypothetical protein W97_04716 [Coniosporium apollinis CBS 100218]